jgi:hypothetical protein
MFNQYTCAHDQPSESHKTCQRNRNNGTVAGICDWSTLGQVAMCCSGSVLPLVVLTTLNFPSRYCPLRKLSMFRIWRTAMRSAANDWIT